MPTVTPFLRIYLLSVVLKEVSLLPQNLIQSELPPDPIDPPDTWVWGNIRNGKIYVATRGYGGGVFNSDKASRRNDKKASINDAIIPVQVSDTISRALDDEDASLMSDIEDLSVNIIDVPENIASASINISKTRNIERELFKEILDEVKKKAEDIEDIQAAVRQKIQSKSFNDIVDLKTINDDTLENDIEIEDLGLRYNDDTFENLTAVILQHTDKVNELGTGMFNASTPTTMLKNVSVTEMKEYFPTENQKDNCIVYSCLIKKAYEQVDKFLFS